MLVSTNSCKLLIVCFLSFIQLSFYCQPSSSFIKEIKKLPDTLRAEFILNHVKELYKKDSTLAKREINDALIFFRGLNNEYPALLSAQSSYHYNKEQLLIALKFETQALEVYEKLKNFHKEISSIKKLTRIYNGLNQSNEAINLLFEKLKKVGGNPERECILLERIGSTFKEIKNKEKALVYLLKAEEKLNSVKTYNTELYISIFSIYKNIGVLYRNNDDFDKAIYYFNKAYAIAEQTDNVNSKGIVLNSIGILYREKKEYTKAIQAFETSIKLKQENNNLAGVSNSHNNLAELYLEVNNIKKAEENFLIAYNLAIQSRQDKPIFEACDGLYKLYNKLNKNNLAYTYLKRAYALKDSLYNSSISEESARLEKMYNTQKQEKEIEISKIKNQQLEKDIQSKNRERNIFITSACLLIVFLIWLVRSFLQKKKINLHLEEKNFLINKQKLLVEEKQKEVIDSIKYAKKIQNAHLTSEAYINKMLQKLQKK